MDISDCLSESDLHQCTAHLLETPALPQHCSNLHRFGACPLILRGAFIIAQDFAFVKGGLGNLGKFCSPLKVSGIWRGTISAFALSDA